MSKGWVHGDTRGTVTVTGGYGHGDRLTFTTTFIRTFN